MKNLTIAKTVIGLLISLSLTTGVGSISYAANDDPGANRLSGRTIPKEFYDDGSNSRFGLYHHGTKQTTSAYTSKNYIHSSLHDSDAIVNGIDVSEYQGEIDWQKVKAAGIDYAFIRVGYRGYGDAGTLDDIKTKDKYFDINIANAIAADIKVGIYIYSQAITTTEAREEAQYILKNIGDYPIRMPLVMDYEYAGDSSGLTGRLYRANLSKATATKICLAFCDEIAKAGYTPMVYANKNMLTDHLNASDITDKGYPIWLALYGKGDYNVLENTYENRHDFWQYSSGGTVDGINGRVDMDFFYTDDPDHYTFGAIPLSSTVIAEVSDQPYTGKSVKPNVTITYKGQVLKKNTDYTLSYADNKKIGKATMKITGIRHFCGTKTLTFKIVPKNMSGFKAKKITTKDITLSWKKNTSADGYQIYRSSSLNGTYKKIKTIKTYKTTSYKNTKLNAGTCYYYKIRSYKKVGKSTYYGAFTAATPLYTEMGYTRNAMAKPAAVIYSTASLESEQLAAPKEKASMSVTYYTKDEAGNGYYYVTFKSGKKKTKGFIEANKVTITKVGKITGDIVNVRKSYSTKSKKLTTLKRNQKVTVLSTKKKKGTTWYKVTFKKKKKTYTGWISAPYLKIQ